MKQNLRVAAVQLQANDRLAENLENVGRCVAIAADSGARLVVLPENFAYFGSEQGKRSIAERLDGDGPILTTLRALAQRHSVSLVAAGLPETSGDPARPFNTALALTAEGAVAGHYRKVHLFDVQLPDGTVMAESAATSPGDQAVVVQLEGVQVGLAICYDLRFPRLFEALVRRGAELIALGAAFTEQTGKDHWHVLLRARAIETQTWMLAAAQFGAHPGKPRSFGHSLICDPWGTIVAQHGEGVGVCCGAVDLAYLRAVRERIPCLRHHKPL